MKARKRRTMTQLDMNLERIKVEHGRLILDGELVGDRFDDNTEAHFVHFWLAVNLADVEHILIGKHVEGVMKEGDDDDD